MRASSLVVVLVLGLSRVWAANVPGDAEKTTALSDLAARAESELRENILPFWLKHAPDRAHRGFFGEVGVDLTAKKGAPRGALLTSRILWTFSAAHERYGDPQYLEMARLAYDDLLAHFWDTEKGGVYWSIEAGGKPLATRKHIYGQVFAIYSLAEFHRATHEAAALDRAIAIYRLVEEHARDRKNGGYFEELDREWRRLDDMNARARIMGGLAPKSQNTLLHIMEAYTNLLRVWPDPQLRDDLTQLVDLMLTRVLNPKTQHLHLFLEDDWTPRSVEISFGHDIEFTWLVCETAGVLGDPALLARAQNAAVAVAAVVLAQGVDVDGGVFNESGPRGLTDANKDWWSQAEAVVGFLNAWQISGELKYLTAARKSWEFIDRSLVNHDTGEWFRASSRDGRPDKRSPLISMWKCPYHNSRACLETVERARAALHRVGGEGP